VTGSLHPAENRGYRELYAFARRLESGWGWLADKTGEEVFRDGADAASDLLTDLERVTPRYGLYGRPAAQGVGAGMSLGRLAARFFERNQALRIALTDLQHVVTLVGYLEQVARSRGDDELVRFCSDWRARLMPVERNARAAAIDLGSRPDEAIEPVDDSPVGKAGARVGWAFGAVGEWFDRRVSGK